MHAEPAVLQVLGSVSFILFAAASSSAPVPAAKPAVSQCLRAVLEGEVNAGQSFTQPIAGNLSFFLQPIHSGWILRVIPSTGPSGDHDYAELATPPYRSVTPLSISTDFTFRAQDAIGWNPRHFRFASSAHDFADLQHAWFNYEQAAPTPPQPLQSELSQRIALASEGTFTILDARLVPGTADQGRMAAAVASHFASTAHTLAHEPNGSTSPLGRILWLRFRLYLDLPANFHPSKAPSASGNRPDHQTLEFVPRTCSTD